MSDPITNAAQEFGRRAARRLHQRVDRDALDRQDVLDTAKAELAVVLSENNANHPTSVLARNIMFAAFANHLNEQFLDGTPGGSDLPAEAMP